MWSMRDLSKIDIAILIKWIRRVLIDSTHRILIRKQKRYVKIFVDHTYTHARISSSSRQNCIECSIIHVLFSATEYLYAFFHVSAVL